MSFALRLALVFVLTSCSGAPTGGPAVATVGADGGTLRVTAKEGTATLVIPAGALTKDLTLSVAVLPATPQGVASPDAAPFLQRSFVLSLQPHGATFSRPVTVTFDDANGGNTVVRLADDADPTWERVAGAEVTPGTKAVSFETSTFSYYAVVTAGHRVSSVPVALAADGSRRSMSPLSYDVSGVYWSEGVPGAPDRLKVWQLALGSPGPVTPFQLASVPLAVSQPSVPVPLVLTTNHVVWRRLGSGNLKGQEIGLDDSASVQKNGSAYNPSAWAAPPFFARGEKLVVDEPFYGIQNPRILEVTLGTGPGTEKVLSPKLRPLAIEHECLHHPASDEVACVEARDAGVLGLAVYGFKDDQVRQLPAVTSALGLEALRQNSTHWFSAATDGLVGWPRLGGAQLTVPGNGWDRSTYAVDDTFAYLCRGGDLTRVKLDDGTSTVLSRDCGRAPSGSGGLATGVLGVDATSVYYLGARSWSTDPPVLEFLRLSKG